MTSDRNLFILEKKISKVNCENIAMAIGNRNNLESDYSLLEFLSNQVLLLISTTENIKCYSHLRLTLKLANKRETCIRKIKLRIGNNEHNSYEKSFKSVV